MRSVTWKDVTNWRLRRGHLATRRAAAKLTDVVSDICGAHAQIMSTVPLALNARLARLKRSRIDTAIADERTLVKTWAMRGTLHVFTAGDLPLYCAAQRTRDQYMNPSFLKYFNLEMADMEAVLDAVPQALDGATLTREELTDRVLRITKRPQLEERLRSGWGEALKPAAFRGLLCFGPQEGRSVRFVRPDQWIGTWRDYDTDDALREVFGRFLSAYGPASREELARWWGVRPPEAGRVLGLMADDLEEVDVEGTKRWMMATDVRSLASTQPVEGVRLLPSFDQLLVMSAPHKQALVDEAFKLRIYTAKPIAVWSLPAVLIDGYVGASWKLEKKTKRAVARVSLFGKPTRAQRSGLEDEADRLSALLGLPVELEVGRA